MAVTDQDRMSLQIAGESESGGPKRVAVDDDGRLKVKINYNPSLGTDHTASGIKMTGTAGEALVFGNLCYIKSDGKLWKVDADAIATMPGLFIALATIAAGAEGSFLAQGFIRDDSWSWTVGAPLYASTTSGGLTETAPSGSLDIVQRVGFALTATIVYLKPSLNLLDAEPVDGSTARGIPSNWAYDHNALDTGVHGAGSDVLATDADITTHAAVLAAHLDDQGRLLRVGAYFFPVPTSGQAQGDAIVASTMYAYPMIIKRNLTIATIAIQPWTTDAGRFARLGIYRSNDALYPTSLVKDFGLVDVGAGGVQAITFSQALTKGLYWCVILSNGTPTFLYNIPGDNPQEMGSGNLNSFNYGWQVAQAYGALPDPFTDGGVVTAIGVLIACSLASLD